MKKNVIITGSAGFIGFHTAKKLLGKNWNVMGIDGFTDYYDVKLKERREAILSKMPNYTSARIQIETPGVLKSIFEELRPEVVIHLAAQAGVRYSIDAPDTYIKSNIVGSFELLEAARAFPPKHTLIASTSSVYGASKQMPYHEMDSANTQMSIYAATKKSTESLAHSYAHLFGLPISIFRFFTVYGPWGRPDMAIFKFTKAILEGTPIDIYNFGDMRRDFTYVDDLVNSLEQLVYKPPLQEVDIGERYPNKINQSVAAPFRLINIGNSNPINLLDFISEIEKAVGKLAIKKYMPMQPGDVKETWADTTRLLELIGAIESTPLSVGVKNFVDWYLNEYDLSRPG
ncbi:GDP-mannose 4,6-dehydratase [Paracoccaceae bacterium]|nr:GDP-mannose 4,6-dehydratase [Paracoccaceae bacterium]